MNQPKYITYKGAKYQKIDTLSEIVVDPLPRCCIIEYGSDRRGITIISVKLERGNPKKVAQDFLDKRKQEAIADGDTPPYCGGYLSEVPDEYDRYSYTAQTHEVDSIIVCTSGKGRWSHLYDLAEAYNAAGKYTAAQYALQDALDDPKLYNWP